MNYKIPLCTGLGLTILIALRSFSLNPYDDVLLFMDNSDRIVDYRYLDNKKQQEYFTGKKKMIDGKEYTIKITANASGKKTKYYIRKGRYNFYQYDSISNMEGILVPISPKIGETWMSADKSIMYKVISLGQRFRTPLKKYKSAIWIQGIPQQNPYGISRSKHYLHYVKGEGLVAKTNTRGDFLKYLADIRQ